VLLRIAEEHPLVYSARTEDENEGITILRKVRYDSPYDRKSYIRRLEYSKMRLSKTSNIAKNIHFTQVFVKVRLGSYAPLLCRTTM
jgi:hypothetical protein